MSGRWLFELYQIPQIGDSKGPANKSQLTITDDMTRPDCKAVFAKGHRLSSQFSPQVSRNHCFPTRPSVV
ncbi:hypothetical protein VTJ04DRAFT_5747 [Mycothermus thermophilus]|uniref:uncharacterized protein n=1 Tax=Humicola insolens TaxID=85995 RepID=UPI0037424D24